MSSDIGAYDPATARMILETVKYLKANGYVIQGGQKRPPIFDAPRIHIGVTTSTITGRSGSDAGTGTATLLYVPGVAGTDYAIDAFPPSGTVEIAIYNIDTAEIASGAHVPLVREYASGKWFAVPSAVNNPQVYVVQATSAITARSSETPGSGTANVQTSLSGSLVLHSPTISLTVYNAYDVAIADGEYLIVCRDDIDQRWWAVPKGGGVGPTSKRVRGTIAGYPDTNAGNPFNSATKADPHTLENIEGIDAPWAGDATLTIYNPEKIKIWGDEPCTARCEYNETSGHWEVYAAKSDKVVHDIAINPNDCQFIQLDGGEGWNNWKTNDKADWIKEVYQLDCYLYFKDNCGNEDTFAVINFVDRVFWDAATCGIKYEFCDGESYAVGEPQFVTDVYQDGCYLFVDKCGEEGVPFAEINFVDRVFWDVSSCGLKYEFCDGTISVVADMPDFVTNVEYNEDNCLLYVERCQGGFEYYELDFVKDVSLSADNCHLVISKCISGDTEIQMPYLTDVYVIGDRMVYDTGCTTEQLIIEFTECD